MKSPGELRVSAARCRRLANGMGNPADVLTLTTLATEYEEQATAAEAVPPGPKPPEM